MNKLYTILAALLLTASTIAQAPEKMSYQAVVRDSGDALVSNQTVGMQISVLQSSASGTAVYVETQTPTTNTNGLVSIEIGMGSVVSGDFSAIDWSAGPYFIKTETDLAGGTNYTITGTSQMLSVPYALHAKTTESVTGLDAIIADLDARVTALEPALVGDFRDGGVVFWVDPTDNAHGLVCAIEDQSTGIQWYNGSYIATGATGTAIGTGLANTDAIIAAQGAIEINYAAGLARAYTGGGYTDWFLPSLDELYEMYLNRATINATAIANGGTTFSTTSSSYYYWSSSEIYSEMARRYSFRLGESDHEWKDRPNYVRAIRAF